MRVSSSVPALVQLPLPQVCSRRTLFSTTHHVPGPTKASEPSRATGTVSLCPHRPSCLFFMANVCNTYSRWASSGQDNHPAALLSASLARSTDVDNDSCTCTSLMPSPRGIQPKENPHPNHTHAYAHTHLHTYTLQCAKGAKDRSGIF